jgi:hypothetical protein
MGDKPIAFLIPMFVGGFVFWLLSGFRGKYGDHLTDEKKGRNFWMGYVICMTLIVIILYTIYHRF